MNRKLLPTLLIATFTVAILLSVSVISADTVSESETDVHGITYREGNNLLHIAVLPSTANVYPVVDWYVYHVGNIAVYVDDEPVHAYSSKGLLVISHLFDMGTSHDVAFHFDNGTVTEFSFTVRNTIYVDDGSLEYVDSTMRMTDNEYNLTIIFSFILGVVCFVIPMYVVYRIFRRLARRGEKVL
jgi:hypothetical protein